MAVSAACPLAVYAQDDSEADRAAGEIRLCGQVVPPPTRLPPPDSPPVVYALGLCFPAQGNVSAVEPDTYLFHIRLRPSRPSQNEWVPYDEAAREAMLADFRRLWDTGFLDDLSIEVTDYRFANGVVGKVVTYHLEERARVRIVKYEGDRIPERSAIEEALRERSIELRADSFLDYAVINRIKSVLRTMLAEEGYGDAEVTHAVEAMAGGPKLVTLTFTVKEGPRLAIRDIEFVGNRAIPDAVLERVMKGTRARTLKTLITGGGRFSEAKFAEDAQAIEDHYRDAGYVTARVGNPELRVLEDSADGATRWVQLRVPVTEGPRYRLGRLTFEGPQVVKAEALRDLVDLDEGDWYSQKAFREALEKAREIYGAAGYMEFTGFPDLAFRDLGSGPDADAASTPVGGTDGATAVRPDPVVDVTFRISEGVRYSVNRITFTGNTITRDNVIRREMRLVEGGIFSTAALKHSIRRLNQLGFFKPLEGTPEEIAVEKTPGREDAVDLTLKLEEQNRNQIQFGAGVSQWEGVFANVAYTTTNFMGRGESLTLMGQKGARSAIYQASFTEPYVFDRPLTAGIDLFSRKIDYLTGADTIGYSEVRSGVNLTAGHALFDFSRLFLTYGYEVIHTAISDDLLEELDADAAVGVPVFNPFLDEGRHVESRITPSFVHNTVDNPYMPRSGRRISLTTTLAGGWLGGTYDYVRPELEVVQYIPHTRRTAIGLRAGTGLVRALGSTRTLPYYLRYFLGGEYQIRGVDIRSVGPTDAQNRALGGDRFVLFNVEYYLDVFGPVRALLFHDAGQAYLETERIDLRRLRTSSGVELRVIVPMLNVPFRLIWAWNRYRDPFQPARAFKIAVGTTF